MINASSYNAFREQMVMEQMIKFIPGQIGEPGHFMSPLPIKPFNSNSVKGNRATAEKTQQRNNPKITKGP